MCFFILEGFFFNKMGVEALNLRLPLAKKPNRHSPKRATHPERSAAGLAAWESWILRTGVWWLSRGAFKKKKKKKNGKRPAREHAPTKLAPIFPIPGRKEKKKKTAALMLDLCVWNLTPSGLK